MSKAVAYKTLGVSNIDMFEKMLVAMVKHHSIDEANARLVVAVGVAYFSDIMIRAVGQSEFERFARKVLFRGGRCFLAV